MSKGVHIMNCSAVYSSSLKKNQTKKVDVQNTHHSWICVVLMCSKQTEQKRIMLCLFKNGIYLSGRKMERTERRQEIVCCLLEAIKYESKSTVLWNLEMTQKYFIREGQESIKSLHQNREHLSEIISVLKNCHMKMQFYHGSLWG